MHLYICKKRKEKKPRTIRKWNGSTSDESILCFNSATAILQMRFAKQAFCFSGTIGDWRTVQHNILAPLAEWQHNSNKTKLQKIGRERRTRCTRKMCCHALTLSHLCVNYTHCYMFSYFKLFSVLFRNFYSGSGTLAEI